MVEFVIKSAQLGFLLKMAFIFSTIYTLAYYWNVGQSTTLQTSGVSDVDATNTEIKPVASGWITGIFDGLIDDILGFIAYINPFWALILLILKEVMPSDMYTFLNLIILRPVGWIGAFITTEWVVNKVRGTSS